MLLEYSYDKGNYIIDQLKKSSIAALTITMVEDGDFVMDYTLVDELPEAKQSLVRKVLSESLAERLQLTNVVNQFVEAMSLEAVKDFSLKFNAINVRKCEISYSSSYKTVIEDNKSLMEKLRNNLEQYDMLITKLGVSDIEIKDIFVKVSGGKGNRKYSPVSMKDLSNVIRTTLSE